MLTGALVGCADPNLASVQGNLVTQDGKPVVGARVIARSASTGKSFRGWTDASGHFELQSDETGVMVPAGEYEVIVAEDLGPMDAQRQPTISNQYRSADTSGLKLSVAAGEDQNVTWTLDGP